MCQEKKRKKKPKQSNQIEDKDTTVEVFTPCIIVFSPLFNVTMLFLTILTRKN
jgi:hypothetical protein